MTQPPAQPMTLEEAVDTIDHHLLLAMDRMADLEEQFLTAPAEDRDQCQRDMALLLAHIRRMIDYAQIAWDQKREETPTTTP